MAMPRNDFAPSGITSCENVKEDTSTFNFASETSRRAVPRGAATTTVGHTAEGDQGLSVGLKFTIPLESQPPTVVHVVLVLDGEDRSGNIWPIVLRVHVQGVQRAES